MAKASSKPKLAKENAFPSYSGICFPKTEKKIVIVDNLNIETAEFKISGMTCSGCEHHVKTEINKLKGTVETTV